MARVLQPFFKFKIVSSMHNDFQRSAAVMRYGDRVIAVSQAVSAGLQARGFPAKKISAITNGPIGSPRQKIRPRRVVDLYRPAVITAAGLYPRKGIVDLLEAFAAISSQHVGAHLYVLGDGPLRGELRDLAAAGVGSDRVHFEGFVEDPESYFRAGDVFVLPSHAEPFGLVLVEARAEGCAMIGTAVGGIHEALSYGKAGILVAPGKPAELADTLDRLLGDQRELAYWKAAAKVGLEAFTLDRMGRETLAVYHALLH